MQLDIDADQAIDAGHRRRLHSRRMVERALELAEHLRPADRELVRAALLDDGGIDDLALRRGQRPRALRERYQRVLTLMNKREFRAAAAVAPLLPHPYDKIARLHWLQDCSVAEIALTLRMDRLKVRELRNGLKHVVHVIGHRMLAAGGGDYHECPEPFDG